MLSLKTLLFRTNIKKASQSALWLFFDKILKMAVSLAVSVYFIRYLGAEQFGLYSAAFSFVALFEILSNLGLPRVVVRELINQNYNKNQILGSSFILLLVSGILFWLIILFLSIFFYGTNDDIFLLITIISLSFLFKCFQIIILFFESKSEFKQIIYITNIVFLASNLAKIGLIIIKAELLSFAILFVVDALFSALSVVFVYLGKGYSFSKWSFKWEIAQYLFRQSWPLTLAGLMVTVNARIDQIMLREMTSEAVVGIYSAAVKISEVLFFYSTHC